MDINFEEARKRAMEKIRKLLAVARDGRGNEHEAAIAAAQAEKLMRHYQVEAAEVILREIEQDESFDRGLEDVSFEGIAGHKPKQVPTWVGTIALGCGKLFTCKVDLVNTPQGLRVRFSGYRLDVELCQWVYRFLCETVYRLSREHGKGQGISYAKSFRAGASMELQKRLYSLAAEREDANLEARTSGNGTAMVLYDRKQQRVDEMFGAQTSRQYRMSGGDDRGYSAGREAGANINIPTNRPVSNAKPSGYIS